MALDLDSVNPRIAHAERSPQAPKSAARDERKLQKLFVGPQVWRPSVSNLVQAATVQSSLTRERIAQ